MVEAFSLRGLALLADSWSTDPPFKDDSGFGAAVAVYRQNIVERYGKLPPNRITQTTSKSGLSNIVPRWRRSQALMPSRKLHLSRSSQNMIAIRPVSKRWSAEPMERPQRDPAGAVFRGLEGSCKELQASAELPSRLQTLLALS